MTASNMTIIKINGFAVRRCCRWFGAARPPQLRRGSDFDSQLVGLIEPIQKTEAAPPRKRGPRIGFPLTRPRQLSSP